MLNSMNGLRRVTLLALLIASSMSRAALAQGAPVEDAPSDASPLKAVVVVAGDPDATMRAEASRVDALVESSALLIRPGDPGLRSALRGEPTDDAEDGLERLRVERRRLGWGEDDDARVLLSIARMSGARVMLVLRRQESITLEIFDVGARAFYQGALPLTGASDEEVVRYVESRAAATRRRADDPTPPSPEVAAAASAEYEAEEALSPTDEAPAETEERWIRRGWPYLVAGALLAGLVVALVVTKGRGEDASPPVLRFRPGGN